MSPTPPPKASTPDTPDFSPEAIAGDVSAERWNYPAPVCRIHRNTHPCAWGCVTPSVNELARALAAERVAHAETRRELDEATLGWKQSHEAHAALLSDIEGDPRKPLDWRKKYIRAFEQLATTETALEAANAKLAQATLVVEAAQRWSKQPGTMAVVVLESALAALAPSTPPDLREDAP